MRRALLLLVLAGLLGPASAVAAAPPLIKVSPERIDFGTRAVGTTDRATVTITNVTSGPVFIGGLTVTAERGGFVFAFGTQNCPQFLDPGASCSYGIDLDVFRRGALIGDSTVTAAQGSANVTVHIPLRARGFRTAPIPHPKTRQVDDDRAQCPHAGYTHIQAAVHAAAPGDRIVVCPGTYVEQVRIRGLPQLALESRDPRAATIRFPRPEKLKSQALVHIAESDEVDLRGFVLSGPFATAGGCGSHSGVKVESSSGALIEGNRITQMRAFDPSDRDCADDGWGVALTRTPNTSSASADIVGNAIDSYQAGGVLVDGENDDARVQGSVISLAAPSLAPTAGIQFSNGASGTVENSDVSGNDRGVWLSGVGEVTVSESYAHDNGEGLSVDSRSRGNLFAANYALHNTRYDCVDRSRGSGTAGTANRWRRSNHGEHNLPQPICKP